MKKIIAILFTIILVLGDCRVTFGATTGDTKTISGSNLDDTSKSDQTVTATYDKDDENGGTWATDNTSEINDKVTVGNHSNSSVHVALKMNNLDKLPGDNVTLGFYSESSKSEESTLKIGTKGDTDGVTYNDWNIPSAEGKETSGDDLTLLTREAYVGVKGKPSIMFNNGKDIANITVEITLGWK